MRSFEFCLPTKGTSVPDCPDWLHEIKYDGYRLRLERDGDRVRLITRGGYNWSSRYPWIVEAARKVRQKQFVLDGEAVVLGVDGISDFNALHSRKHDYEVQFCAFDILAEGGDDFRMLPLSMRKASLEHLLARRPEGVFVNPFERGELGPDLFRAACNMGLEGLASKRRDRPYQAGRCKYWVKVKSRSHPGARAVSRAAGPLCTNAGPQRPIGPLRLGAEAGPSAINQIRLLRSTIRGRRTAATPSN
ncbi:MULTISPECIES: ATP-dependent DNA ligase [Bradyrhizobium]|uniref:ATP-dependent DNA ligase n=1 Tax=Bradyrhizobium TaxID=374 RepID=UPI0004B36DB2|nr:RNA ligase family protein [Bradyrhizobium liaoningense]GLR94157.1 DNA ligase [Bradyrhizobium liaoningense]